MHQDYDFVATSQQAPGASGKYLRLTQIGDAIFSKKSKILSIEARKLIAHTFRERPDQKSGRLSFKGNISLYSTLIS